MRKVAKAQWYAKNEGLVYGKILSFCPLNWRTAGRRRAAGAAGGDRQLLLPALRDRARPHDAHLRSRRDRPPPSGVGLAQAHGQDPPPAHARERADRRRASRPRPTAAGRGSRRCTSTRTAVGGRHDMAQILETRRLTPVTKYFRIDAPLIAASAQPGQFVMLRVREGGERIPITIADYDREAGTHHDRGAGSRRHHQAGVRARGGRRDPRRGRPAGRPHRDPAGRPRLRRGRRLRLGGAAVPDARVHRPRRPHHGDPRGAQQGPADPGRRAAAAVHATSRSAPTTARPDSRASSRSAWRS